ncbi:MDIS1-interacting receptor like kinase 2-like [Capsicum annuum]|uniref:MDIS1-interacting receptor like kinase 2-like n=1 Tax=Capsicum annuum TaxID=4072 RepID=UPI001FB0F5B6|nr:MDIS1-interacting receptor like kinase 2-like [Capsicum annuum]
MEDREESSGLSYHVGKQSVSFLVYKFLEGGSLPERLRNDEKVTELDWIKRVNIVKGVAYVLSYMHHECSPPILHRDISSKNVLLDHEDRPHLSDFGTAKLLRPNSSNWTSFAGTFGYVAPKLAYTMEINESCETYSSGLLSLEVILGQHLADLVHTKARMEMFIQGEDYELWDRITDGPTIPMKTVDGAQVRKERNKFTTDDLVALRKNTKVKNILVYGLGPAEYNRVSICTTVKQI